MKNVGSVSVVHIAYLKVLPEMPPLHIFFETFALGFAQKILS